MAWVNYVNLCITRTSRRFREIATRKVSGAGAADMVGQFVTEAFVINVLALALAVTLIQIIRSPVSVLFNIQIANFCSLSLISVAIFSPLSSLEFCFQEYTRPSSLCLIRQGFCLT